MAFYVFFSFFAPLREGALTPTSNEKREARKKLAGAFKPVRGFCNFYNFLSKNILLLLLMAKSRLDLNNFNSFSLYSVRSSEMLVQLGQAQQTLYGFGEQKLVSKTCTRTR